MKPNRIRQALASRGVALGTWAQMASPEFVELVGHVGFDFVIIDLEHGSFGIETAVNMIRAAEAANTAPIVRVASGSEWEILKVLDAGALGILVPGVSTAEQAKQVVRAAKYGPTGIRGACPATRATGHGAWAWSEYLRWANSETMVWLLVEGVEGIRNFDDIISVEGVDVVAVGPFDLSQAMGLEGQVSHPRVVEAMEGLTAKATAKGVEVLTVLFQSNPEELGKAAQQWLARGSRIFTASGDRFLLSSGFRAILSKLGSLRRDS